MVGNRRCSAKCWNFHFFENNFCGLETNTEKNYVVNFCLKGINLYLVYRYTCFRSKFEKDINKKFQSDDLQLDAYLPYFIPIFRANSSFRYQNRHEMGHNKASNVFESSNQLYRKGLEPRTRKKIFLKMYSSYQQCIGTTYQ